MKKFLIISHRPQMVEQFRLAMELLNQKCISAHSAKKALKLHLKTFDAIFIDGFIERTTPKKLKQLLQKKYSVPIIICYGSNERSENSAFSAWDRQDFNKILLERELINQSDFNSNITPYTAFLDTVFLKLLVHIASLKRPSIEPHYQEFQRYGYFYPEVEKFLACDSRDSIATLNLLHKREVLNRNLVDRLYLCNRCDSHSLHFREICPGCQSINFTPVEVVHHFLCGYVGEFDEFYHSDTKKLLCPKCSDTLRHIGLDYEKPATTFKCNSCGINFQEPAVAPYCPQCATLLESDAVTPLEIFSYQLSPKGLQAIEHNQLETSITATAHEPFCTPYELFKFMLKQNLAEAAYEKNPIFITIFHGLNFTQTQRREMLAYLNEIKHPASLVTINDQNLIISQSVRINREKLNQQLDLIAQFVKERGGKLSIFSGNIGHKPSNTLNKFIAKYKSRFSSFKEGIFFDEK